MFASKQMAFKRSPVRSRLSPPKKALIHDVSQCFFILLVVCQSYQRGQVKRKIRMICLTLIFVGNVFHDVFNSTVENFTKHFNGICADAFVSL